MRRWRLAFFGSRISVTIQRDNDVSLGSRAKLQSFLKIVCVVTVRIIYRRIKIYHKYFGLGLNIFFIEPWSFDGLITISDLYDNTYEIYLAHVKAYHKRQDERCKLKQQRTSFCAVLIKICNLITTVGALIFRSNILYSNWNHALCNFRSNLPRHMFISY